MIRFRNFPMNNIFIITVVLIIMLADFKEKKHRIKEASLGSVGEIIEVHMLT